MNHEHSQTTLNSEREAVAMNYNTGCVTKLTWLFISSQKSLNWHVKLDFSRHNFQAYTTLMEAMQATDDDQPSLAPGARGEPGARLDQPEPSLWTTDCDTINDQYYYTATS